MTREEAKQNLQALGIEEPSEAQVTNYLNQFHSTKPEPNKEPKPEPKPNNEPKPNKEPKPEPDGEIAKLQEKIAQLEKESARKDIRAYAAEKGITGEKVENVLSVFLDDVEKAKTAIDSLSEIIADRETTAAKNKEKEIADGTKNPGGGDQKPKDDEERTEAEKTAESIGKSMAESSKASKAVLDSYL